MYDNFVYQSQAVRVLFGCGKAQAVPAERLEFHKCSRALILCTAQAARAPSASSRRRPTASPISIAPKTGDARERLAKIIDHAKEKNADCLLVIGGGSPMGFAKTVAANAGLRSIAVVTTYSGSEMANGSSMAPDMDRVGGGRPMSAAQRDLRPDLTLSLPPRISAASGMNAMAHAVEFSLRPRREPGSRTAGGQRGRAHWR